MLRVRHYNLENELISENLKIVNITDIHSDVEKFKLALDYANSIKADLITIAGDLFDSVDNKHNQAIVDLLRENKIKTIIGLGNHDLITFDKKGFFAKTHENKDCRYFEELKEFSIITVIDDNKQIIEFKGIEIVSLDPGYSWYFETRENKEKFKSVFYDFLTNIGGSNKFRIMLLHSCNALLDDNELKNSIDNVNLVLSGHNHAGILPDCLQGISKYNRGLIGPFEKWFMKSCYGFWTKDSTSVILSNGLTKMGEGHGPAWLCKAINHTLKCDIEVINLKNGNTHELVLEKKELKKQ